LQWTEIIYLQHTQAMIRAIVHTKNMQNDLSLVREAQAVMRTRSPFFYTPAREVEELVKLQGLLAEFVVHIDPDHYPQKSWATCLAQACMRKAEHTAREHALNSAVEFTQANMRTKNTSSQFKDKCDAVNSYVAVMKTRNSLGIKYVRDRICEAQALFLSKKLSITHISLVDLTSKVQPMFLANSAAHKLEVLKNATVSVQALIRGDRIKNKHEQSISDCVLRSQALLRAKSSQFAALRDRSSLCAALIRSRKENKDYCDKCGAVEKA